MNRWSLLKAMTLMELRTTLRERHQMLGMAVGIIILVFALAMPVQKALREARGKAERQQASGQVVAWTPEAMVLGRWIAIAAGSGLGLFFSLGYVISAALASFVGEKEAKTLEILLASPISDTTLFLTKCISVLLPSAAIGYLLILVPSLVVGVIARDALRLVPFNAPFYVLVLSMPPMMLVQLALVGLTAAVSSKAETVRGAGQVVGAVFMIPFFGISYGVPMLLQVPAIREPAKAYGMIWMQLPFSTQYGVGLLMLAVPALILLGVGRALFRRDRLLT